MRMKYAKGGPGMESEMKLDRNLIETLSNRERNF